MGRIMWKPMCAGLALLAGVATAAPTTPPGQGWEPGEADGVTVYLRPVSGTDRYEIWVRTVLNAPARELQQTLLDAERFHTFMPHTEAVRYLGEPGPVALTYTLIDVPVVGKRDYVSEVRTLEEVGPDGSGRFRQRWRAVEDRLPERHGITRLRHNEGSWDIRPMSDGRSEVLYRFSVDPGGSFLGMLAKVTARKAVVGTLRAVEKEARRRSVEAASARMPPSSPGGP
ncbi:MAG TPA: SRPBCC family protein [Myxococcaceae bacterium]|nr:SRPBCC family protein [Myxococcaceae bacterium]